MKKMTYIIACLMLCFFADASYAELIKYIDKDGTLCFADDMGKVPKKYRKNIIRDEEIAEQSSMDHSLNDSAIICYNGFLKTINGRDIADFIAARGHSSSLYNVSKNPEHKRFCADLWCKYRDRASPLDISYCMKEKLAEDTSRYYHFIIVRDQMILSTDPDIALRLIDKYYNIDPKKQYDFKR